MTPYPQANYSLWKFDEVFQYMPDSGNIIWKSRPISHFVSAHAMGVTNSKFAGKVAGHTHTYKGRRKGMRVRVFGRLHEVHRLIWESQNGPIPQGFVIDHIDGDPWNNRMDNLRLATVAQNGYNSKLLPNSTGFRGVTRERHYDKYKAVIYADGKRHYLGLFDTPEIAHEAYLAAAENLHGRFMSKQTSAHV